jgi:mycothiol system anti-sigma-R factor
MSLEDIRSECADTARLLQPYVDGELALPEQERVAGHLESCRPCRVAVDEQNWVRSALRSVAAERAPESLRASILARLDAVDAEARAARPGLLARAIAHATELLRGGLVLVPAGAVAIGLFFVAREGVIPVESLGGTTGLGAASITAPAVAAPAKSPPATAATAPAPAVPAPLADSDRGAADLRLFDAQLDPDPDRAARMSYEVWRGGKPTGAMVVDSQRRAGGAQPRGIPVVRGGRRYLLDRGEHGEPVLHFEVDGIEHMLQFEGDRGTASTADLSLLFEFADGKLGQTVATQPQPSRAAPEP